MPKGDGYDSLYKELGRRVANARNGAKLKQAELAEQVGLTRVSIANIESGRQRPPLHLLWQIAAVVKEDLFKIIPNPMDVAPNAGPAHLEPRIVESIERAVQHDPRAKGALVEFIRTATSSIEGQDAED